MTTARSASEILDSLAKLGKQAGETTKPSELLAVQVRVDEDKRALDALTNPGGPLPAEAKGLLASMADLAQQAGGATTMQALYVAEAQLEGLRRQFDALVSPPGQLPEAAQALLASISALGQEAARTTDAAELERIAGELSALKTRFDQALAT